MATSRVIGLAAIVCGLAGSALASDGLRVVTWNVTNYSSGRVSEFGTSIYGSFSGRQMAPDVIIGQEFLSVSGVNNFLNILNTASGSPGDWAAAPFQNGNDTDNAFFYRTSMVDFLGMTVVSIGSGSPNHPRDVNRYDVRLKGYSDDSTVIAMYSSHMKAGSGSSDQARRLVEAEEIRDDAQALNPDWHFILGADLNTQRHTQPAYIELIGSQANNQGRFWDPIATPGSWNNNSSFRFVHTQDPTGAGGMDDRHDQLLVSDSLIDGLGVDYIGLAGVPYSTVTWNDLNHSYRSWGNDGTSYNGQITTTGNQMVGATIALALRNSAGSGGHLPVFFDLSVPAKITAGSVVDFGTVNVGDAVQESVMVGNGGDTGLWGVSGIEDVSYTLSAPAPFGAPAGSFNDAAGGALNAHTISLNTSSPGTFSELLTITSNDPDQPTTTVQLLAEIVANCVPDLAAPFGQLDFFDILEYLDLFDAMDPAADLAAPFGDFDFFDLLTYLDLFDQGCP